MHNLKETEQNWKEYQGFGEIVAFEQKNARSDFVAVTEKNEEQYIYIKCTLFLEIILCAHILFFEKLKFKYSYSATLLVSEWPCLIKLQTPQTELVFY